MSKFCPNCKNQLDDNVNFCNKCGFNVKSSKDSINTICEYCGAYNSFGDGTCDRCGKPLKKVSHNLAIVLGYIFAVLLPIVGVVFAVYLLTRKNTKARKNAIRIIIVAIVFLIVGRFFISRLSVL